MSRRQLTRRELEVALEAATDEIAALKSNLDSYIKESDRLKRISKHKDSMLAYYINTNTPSPAESLE